MRPSLVAALWMVAGVGTIAAAIALLVGLVAEWGAITGALASGSAFDLWLVIEVAFVVTLVALLVGRTGQARGR